MKTAPDCLYSPDTASINFYLGRSVKKRLVCCSFVEAEEPFQAVQEVLDGIE
jgi:hypothetical protein